MYIMLEIIINNLMITNVPLMFSGGREKVHWEQMS